MALSETTIVGKIQRALRDPSTAVYATADIQNSLTEALSDVAEYVPEINLATVTTKAGTASINIGGVSNMLYGEHEMSFEAVEFPIDEDPIRWRNFSVRGSVMDLDIDFTPNASEDVRLYVREPHFLSGSTSTLDVRLEKIITGYVAGKVLVDQAIDAIDAANVGGPNTVTQFEATGQRKMDRAITQLKSMMTARMMIEYRRDR